MKKTEKVKALIIIVIISLIVFVICSNWNGFNFIIA